MSDHLAPDEEYERRFLVDDLRILEGVEHYREIQQAYLWVDGGYAIRVRLIRDPVASGEDGNCVAYLTLKGPRERPRDQMRYEAEREIDVRHAEAIISIAPHVVTKRRYSIIAGETFDIDFFTGRNEGLVIAEFEASPQAVARLQKPWFASREVTFDQRYSNDGLAISPWRNWPEHQ